MSNIMFSMYLQYPCLCSFWISLFNFFSSSLFGFCFDCLLRTLRRASKSPDFAGDLPIFDKNNENLPISRFGMKISRFFLQETMLARSIASFAIAVGETIFSLANFV